MNLKENFSSFFGLCTTQVHFAWVSFNAGFFRCVHRANSLFPPQIFGRVNWVFHQAIFRFYEERFTLWFSYFLNINLQRNDFQRVKLTVLNKLRKQLSLRKSTKIAS